jgi:hypothetical protein
MWFARPGLTPGLSFLDPGLDPASRASFPLKMVGRGLLEWSVIAADDRHRRLPVLVLHLRIIIELAVDLPGTMYEVSLGRSGCELADSDGALWTVISFEMLEWALLKLAVVLADDCDLRMAIDVVGQGIVVSVSVFGVCRRDELLRGVPVGIGE